LINVVGDFILDSPVVHYLEQKKYGSPFLRK